MFCVGKTPGVLGGGFCWGETPVDLSFCLQREDFNLCDSL